MVNFNSIHVLHVKNILNPTFSMITLKMVLSLKFLSKSSVTDFGLVLIFSKVKWVTQNFNDW